MPTPGDRTTPPTLRFVTSNPGKFREVAELLRPRGFRVVRLGRPLPEPQADSLEEVVRAKLAAVSGLPGIVLVEDSGLFLPALGGFPGVYSAYAYRTLGLTRIARLLNGGSRAAVFRAVLGVRAGGRSWICRGEVRGRLAERPRGSGGFGYDPLFVPKGHRKTFAEMGTEAKSSLSHRRRALDGAIPILRRLAARDRRHRLARR
jgi:XTP/dITP diphosphohydrolase